MTLPTTEITLLQTSELFRAGPELLKPALERLRVNGVDVPLYYGLEAEDPKVGFIFVNWDSYEHHQEVKKASFYRELTEGLAPAIAGPPKVYHAQFSAPTVALDHPVTEVVLFALKTPENRAAAMDVFSKIAKFTENLFAFGVTREDENRYMAICGWESVEAHKQSASKPEVQEITKKLLSVVDADFVYHAKLKKFGPV